MTLSADDESEVRRLDDAWNDAYRRSDRSGLADILAEDFTGLTLTGEAVTKTSLMVTPPPPAKPPLFAEQFIAVFGTAAISRGRLQLELTDRNLDQRFLRVFAKREGRWRAVAVSVSPVPA